MFVTSTLSGVNERLLLWHNGFWWLAASCQTCHLAYLQRWKMACMVYTNRILQSLTVGGDHA